jgi:hypothetical protein
MGMGEGKTLPWMRGIFADEGALGVYPENPFIKSWARHMMAGAPRSREIPFIVTKSLCTLIADEYIESSLSQEGLGREAV